MNISLCVLWWLNLNDQIDTWDVESTGGNVSGDENFAFVCFELFQGNLALSLSYFTVDHLDVLLDLLAEFDLVGFFLGGAEDDCLATSIASKDVGQC